MKHCNLCDQDLPATEEFFRLSKRTGKPISPCRRCVNAGGRKWRNEIKEGTREHPRGLDLNAQVRRHNRLYRARQYNAVCEHGEDCFHKAAEAALEGGACFYCGHTSNLEADHKEPMSSGGKDCRDNFQLLCRSCNRLNRFLPTDLLHL